MIAQQVFSKEFRTALGQFATGVTIVTGKDESGDPFGLTVNSFSSVSLDPQIVLWSLSNRSSCLHRFRKAKHFGVNVLGHGQMDLATTFSSKQADRFSGVEWTSGRTGVPLFDGSAAHFECSVSKMYEEGDHFIFLGQVEHFRHDSQAPLLFHAGRFLHVA